MTVKQNRCQSSRIQKKTTYCYLYILCNNALAVYLVTMHADIMKIIYANNILLLYLAKRQEGHMFSLKKTLIHIHAIVIGYTK